MFTGARCDRDHNVFSISPVVSDRTGPIQNSDVPGPVPVHFWLDRSISTREHPLLFPKLHPCLRSSVGMRQGTDIQTHRHTDGRDQYTFRLGYTSRKIAHLWHPAKVRFINALNNNKM